jgi:phosphoribulokinase
MKGFFFLQIFFFLNLENFLEILLDTFFFYIRETMDYNLQHFLDKARHANFFKTRLLLILDLKPIF